MVSRMEILPCLYGTVQFGAPKEIVGEHMDFRGNLMKELNHLSGIIRDMLEIKKKLFSSLGMEAGGHGGHLCP